jgi:hypothetical protein
VSLETRKFSRSDAASVEKSVDQPVKRARLPSLDPEKSDPDAGSRTDAIGRHNARHLPDDLDRLRGVGQDNFHLNSFADFGQRFHRFEKNAVLRKISGVRVDLFFPANNANFYLGLDPWFRPSFYDLYTFNQTIVPLERTTIIHDREKCRKEKQREDQPNIRLIPVDFVFLDGHMNSLQPG